MHIGTDSVAAACGKVFPRESSRMGEFVASALARVQQVQQRHCLISSIVTIQPSTNISEKKNDYHHAEGQQLASRIRLQRITYSRSGSTHERGKVAAPWTVESLAAASGMSRSAFAMRFKEMVGETPLEYLTTWRMQKAASLLRKGDQKLIDVSVGYDSHAAFSKAFKRVVHVAPPRQFKESSLTWRAVRTWRSADCCASSHPSKIGCDNAAM